MDSYQDNKCEPAGLQARARHAYLRVVLGCQPSFWTLYTGPLFYGREKIFGLDPQSSIISVCDDNNHHISLNLKEHMDTNVQHIFILSSDHA